jgi:hypothetical protein
MPRNQKDFTYDQATRLNDVGAITASQGGMVASAPRVLNIGGTNSITGAARLDARVIYDVAAIAVASADQVYRLELQVSNDITFATGVQVASSLTLGNATATGQSASSVIGRFEDAFTNELNGTSYTYCRLFLRIAGTAPSISVAAYLAVEY